MKEKLSTKILLENKPLGWKENWGEYSRIGMILDNYSIQEKIEYLINNAFYETTLNSELDRQITEFIILKEKYRNGKQY